MAAVRAGTAVGVFATSGTGGGTVPGGTCSKPITLTNFPGQRPIVTGTRASYVLGGANPLSCIVVNGFEIAGWNAALTWAGASANATATGTGWQNANYIGSAIFFGGSTSQPVHHITVTNTYIHDFPGAGISVNYGDYNTVAGNTVFNTSNFSPFATSGISLYELHNIDAGTGTKNVISGNLGYANVNYIPNHTGIFTCTVGTTVNSGGNSINYSACSGGSPNYTMGVIDSSGCIPQGTTVNNLPGGSVFGINSFTTCNLASGDVLQLGYLTDGEGITIDNNTNTQSDSVAYVGRSLVTNNVEFNNGSGGLECGPLSTACDFTFNTLYQNQSGPGFLGNSSTSGELNFGGATSSNAYNNAMVALSSNPLYPVAAGSGTTWANNAFSGGNGSGTQPGTGNVLTAPSFVNATISAATANFQLNSGSPLIGAASPTYTRTADFYGNPGLVGAGYDIGASEYQAVTLNAITGRYLVP